MDLRTNTYKSVNVFTDKVLLLCSLYHAKDLELNGKPASGGMFDNGSYGDTPDYLGAYEARAMRKIRR